MARINAGLIPALMKRLNLKQARIYSLIQEISATNRVPRHLGALLLAGDNGISFQKYATAQDLAELQGLRSHTPVDVGAVIPTRALSKRGKSKAVSKPKDNTVFVVYGRDEELRKSVFNFLRALSLKPFEWAHALDQVKKGNPDVKTVIEITMAKASAVLVLFSPDDEVRLKENLRSRDEKKTEAKLVGQPRPNVLFEAGLALGAHPEKTLFVQVGKVRGFTDISGLHMARLTNETDRRNDVANRLAKIGCKVDRVGKDWMTAGDFNR